jgi:hypothetical protein
MIIDRPLQAVRFDAGTGFVPWQAYLRYTTDGNTHHHCDRCVSSRPWHFFCHVGDGIESYQ